MSEGQNGASLRFRAGRRGRNDSAPGDLRTKESVQFTLLNYKAAVFTILQRGGIRRRLLLWGLGLFGIALTAVVVATYFYTLRQIERDAAALQSEIALVTADRIRTFVRRKIERFSDTASAASLYPLGSKEQLLLASLLVKNDVSFTDASIIDARGVEVLKVSDRKVYFPSDLSDQGNSAKFKRAVKGENYISRVYTSDKFQPYVTMAIPLWGNDQRIVGVAAAEADLSFLWEVIEQIKFGSAGYGYLVDDQGNLIAHKDTSLVVKKINLRHLDTIREFLRDPTGSDPAPARKGRGLMDKPVLATYAPVPNLGWAVILEEPLDAALVNVEKLKRYASVLLTVGLVLGIAIIAWVSKKIIAPIRELHEGARIIGGGNLDYRVNIRTRDEIESLGEEFNKMAGQLKLSHETLEQKVKDKTAALEEANSELEQANYSLVRASNAKNEFLSVMSHELRTPLNVVLGYTQLVKDGLFGGLNPEQDRALTKAIGRSKELLSMISEILQATSIESGKIKMDLHDVQLEQILGELRSTYDFALNDNKLSFHWDYPSESVTIRTDGDKLKHILQNLISNAIKFTDEGQIRVSAGYFPESKIAEFKVADTGRGIQGDLIPSIFEMFHQLDGSETRHHGGAGLGLYIVKKFTDALGGHIHVESKVGRGSVFTVTIPC